jgi:hypothetical protein
MKRLIAVLICAALLMSPAVTAVAVSSTVIVLRVGDPTMTVNGTRSPIDVNGTTPVIVGGRTMLPFRSIVEALNGSVTWNAVPRTVGIAFEDHQLELTIGKAIAVVDGTSIRIDPTNPSVVPIILGGRTMLPVRFVAEQLGGSVEWTASTRTVTLSFNAAATPPAAPVLLTPATSSSFQSTTPTLTWTPSEGARSYHVVIQRDAVAIVDKSGISAASYAVPPGTLTPGTYRWTVRATGDGGTGPAQATPFVFTVTAPPEPPRAPTLLAPASGSSFESTTPTLTWEPVPGATSYHLIIMRSTTRVLDTGGLTATSLSVAPGTLTPASYSWTVTATGPGGTSAPLATAFTFTVLSPQPSAQTVEMRVKYTGWDPATLHIKAGARVTWIIWGDEVTSCTNRIIVPSLSISLPLKAGKNSVIFTAPSKAGVVPFSCWMGMVRGQFVVDP